MSWEGLDTEHLQQNWLATHFQGRFISSLLSNNLALGFQKKQECIRHFNNIDIFYLTSKLGEYITKSPTLLTMCIIQQHKLFL